MHFILLETTAPGRDPATTWIAIAAGIMAVVYVTLVRPLRKKKDKDPLERAPAFSTLSQQRAVERDMSNLLVELSEMARQMTAQLDTRAAKLELLLKEADERIAILKSGEPISGQNGHPPLADSSGSKDAESVIVQARAMGIAALPEPKIDPRHAPVYDLAD